MSGAPFPSPTLLGFRGERRAPGSRVRLKQFPGSLSPLLSPHATALDYVLDGDTDRRLRGQVPRVTFLSRGPDDPKHQASGTVWLKHQHDRVCGDTMFQLQVDTDPLVSEGHCHCMISSLIPFSFLLNTLTPHSETSAFGKPPLLAVLLSCCLCMSPAKFSAPWRWGWQGPLSHLILKALSPGSLLFTSVALPALCSVLYFCPSSP